MSDYETVNGIQPASFLPKGVFLRTGERDRSVGNDPAFDAPGAAPGFSRYPLSHISTFSGVFTTAARTYLYADEAMRDSIENARVMRNDVGVMECLEARQRAVALLGWHLEPEDEKDKRQVALCEELTKVISRIGRFQELRRNLLEALWYGRYAVQFRYRWATIGGKRRVVPVRKRDNPGWRPIHGDKLVWRFERYPGDPMADKLGIRIHGGRFDEGAEIGVQGRRARIEATDRGLAYFLTDPERDRVAIHKHIIEDGEFEDPRSGGSIHGVGIRSRIYWEWLQKQELLAFLMEFLERSAGGIRVWTYPEGHEGALENAQEASRNLTGGSKTDLFFPKPIGDDVNAYGLEIVEPGMGGVEQLHSLLDEYFGHRIKRYILGQTLTTEAAATGLGSGVADAHKDSFMQIVEHDANNLDETMTEELINTLKAWNFPDMRDVHVRFVSDLAVDDVKEKLDALNQAWGMGARIAEREVLDMVGLDAPGPEDKVLENQQAGQDPQQGGGMFPGMDGGDEAPPAGGEQESGDAEPQVLSGDGKVTPRGDGDAPEQFGADQGSFGWGKKDDQGQFRWVTLNADSGDDGDGGTRVMIDDSGNIQAGPESLEGKSLGNLDKDVSGSERDKRKDNEPPGGDDSAIEVGDIHYTRPPGEDYADYQVMTMDVDALDAAFSLDSQNYVPAEGEGVEGRREGVESFIASGGGRESKPMEMPVMMDMNPGTGAARFQDGRHRFAVLRDAGQKQIPVLVAPEDVEDFEWMASGSDSKSSKSESGDGDAPSRLRESSPDQIESSIEATRPTFARDVSDIPGLSREEQDELDDLAGGKAGRDFEVPYIKARSAGLSHEDAVIYGIGVQFGKGGAYLHEKWNPGQYARPRRAAQYERREFVGQELIRRYDRQSRLWDESAHPRNPDGEFAEKNEGAGDAKVVSSEKSKKTSRKAPGSQLTNAQKQRASELGMTGTFPPADVPIEDIEFAPEDATVEELKHKPIMKWKQKTKSGRISRQYRYTKEFHERNAAAKYDRVRSVEPHLGKAMGVLHERMRHGDDAAAIASIISETGLRPTDNPESVKHGHFGIASLRADHAKKNGGEIRLDFIGKEGVRNETVVRDPKNVVYIAERLKDRSGDQPLWDSDSSAAAAALKDAVKEVGGPGDVKIKDLRTIKAMRTAREVVSEFKGPPPPLTGDEKKDARAITSAVLKMSKSVSEVLNNTAAQARDNYIDPLIFKAWINGLTTTGGES